MLFSRTPIFFLHIPKTAGTVVRSMIADNVADEKRLEVFDPKPLWHMADRDFAPYQVIYGHIGYGFMHRLPKKTRCFTFLRDPIERLISLYNYWREVPGGPGTVGPDQAKQYDPDDFFALDDPLLLSELDNLQTWMLFKDKGIVVRQQYAAMAMNEVYSQAKQHLERCDFVGLQARFDDDVKTIAKRYGWQLPEQTRQNTSSGVLSISNLSDTIKIRLEELTQYDRKLYELALSLR